ncbi:hypothetical protein LTR06_010870 [Exophiala xenobiotica]|nr:hypothetical protein LTR06_010870 [Exophiala xenobiotica]
MTPANAFETSVGHFWGILSTRDYMRARYDLADTVRRVGSLDGVTEALEHMRDMLRLCRGDNMGVRDLIPPMMLQLDRDQECYDFIKWYQTEGQRSDYDWGNPDLPFLEVHDANVLEGLQYLNVERGDVPHISALLLLKLKLLIDVIALTLTRQVIPGQLPPELGEQVEMHVIRSPISHQWVGKSSEELKNAQQKLQSQVMFIASSMRNLNEHYVDVLLDAEKYLPNPADYYSPGSFEEMLRILQHSYSAWWQHEGVLEILQSAKVIAGKDSEDEIEDMMDTLTFRNNPGSDRSKEEMLDDVSRNRLWGYLDHAVMDAMSLSKDRPSDLERLRLKAEWEAAEREEREFEEGDSDEVYEWGDSDDSD